MPELKFTGRNLIYHLKIKKISLLSSHTLTLFISDVTVCIRQQMGIIRCIIVRNQEKGFRMYFANHNIIIGIGELVVITCGLWIIDGIPGSGLCTAAAVAFVHKPVSTGRFSASYFVTVHSVFNFCLASWIYEPAVHKFQFVKDLKYEPLAHITDK